MTTPTSPSAPRRKTVAMLVIVSMVLVPLQMLLESRLAPQRAAALTARAQGQLASTVFGNAAPHPPRDLRYRSTDAPGYGGDIRLLLAIDAQGCLRGVVALAHHESPGYGAPLLSRQALADREGWLRGLLDRCHETPAGTGAAARMDGTTGATITANAVTRALRAAMVSTSAAAPATALQQARPSADARQRPDAGPGQ